MKPVRERLWLDCYHNQDEHGKEVASCEAHEDVEAVIKKIWANIDKNCSTTLKDFAKRRFMDLPVWQFQAPWD